MGWIWGNDERLLTPPEERLIRKVFRTTILPPMSRIRIRDGLSPTGTPITTPRSQARLNGAKLESKSDYLIMVGRRLFDDDVSDSDPDTLVHEVTHVWQYMHGTLTQAGALAAHVGYWLGEELTRPVINPPGQTPSSPLIEYNNLYSYKIGPSWNEMGFEGQAQMVEEWYSQDKMSETADRWLYVKNVLMMHDRRARSLTLEELKARAAPSPESEPAELPDLVAFDEIPFSDGYLLRVLQQAIKPNDIPAMAARVKTLENYTRQFRRVKLGDALVLAARLDAQKPSDKLAQAFHYRLSSPTRDRLLKILRGLA